MVRQAGTPKEDTESTFGGVFPLNESKGGSTD